MTRDAGERATELLGGAARADGHGAQLRAVADRAPPGARARAAEHAARLAARRAERASAPPQATQRAGSRHRSHDERRCVARAARPAPAPAPRAPPPAPAATPRTGCGREPGSRRRLLLGGDDLAASRCRAVATSCDPADLDQALHLDAARVRREEQRGPALLLPHQRGVARRARRVRAARRAGRRRRPRSR